MGGEAKNYSSFWKWASYSPFQFVPSCFFNNLKNGLAMYAVLGRNMGSATSWSMSLCISAPSPMKMT